MKTGNKCKVTNSSLNHTAWAAICQIKQPDEISAVCLLRTLIFQILPEKKVQKVIFFSRSSITLCKAIEKVMTCWDPYCVIAMHITMSLSYCSKIYLLKYASNLEFPSVETNKLLWEILYFEVLPPHGTDMLFAFATYVCFSTMFSFPTSSYGIQLLYTFLTADTAFYPLFEMLV